METVRVLIVYDSKTGNVETMAHAVEEGAEEAGALVDLKRVEDVDINTFSSYDAYAFGSPTHCGTMSVKMNDFINNRMHPKYWGKLRYKVAVAFTSSGGLGGGNETVLWALISTILNFGMMTFGIPDYVSKDVTLHYGAVAIKKPNKNSLNACRLLGRQLVEYAKVVKAGLNAK
ncbi:MAG: flavodoxin domain-containing protein [Nitrososphaeria archaeon]|jgi:NAD(P)H dehydrogenase (quinone)